MLEPLYDTTTFLSGEQYPTISLADQRIRVVDRLMADQLAEEKRAAEEDEEELDAAVVEFVGHLRDALKTRFDKVTSLLPGLFPLLCTGLVCCVCCTEVWFLLLPVRSLPALSEFRSWLWHPRFFSFICAPLLVVLRSSDLLPLSLPLILRSLVRPAARDGVRCPGD